MREPSPTAAIRPAPPAWLDECRAGNAVAITAMFNASCGMVERTIYRLIGATPDLEDLVQNTFMEALRSLPRYRGEASFTTWLTSIAVHVAHHHLRSAKLRRHAPLESVPDHQLPTSTHDAERQLDERRLVGHLHGLLDRISPSQRVALLLFAVEGLAIDEVAALMGASPTTTRSRVFFGRRALRALIKEDPGLRAIVADLLDHQPEDAP